MGFGRRRTRVWIGRARRGWGARGRGARRLIGKIDGGGLARTRAVFGIFYALRIGLDDRNGRDALLRCGIDHPDVPGAVVRRICVNVVKIISFARIAACAKVIVGIWLSIRPLRNANEETIFRRTIFGHGAFDVGSHIGSAARFRDLIKKLRSRSWRGLRIGGARRRARFGRIIWNGCVGRVGGAWFLCARSRSRCGRMGRGNDLRFDYNWSTRRARSARNCARWTRARVGLRWSRLGDEFSGATGERKDEYGE